LSLHTATTVTAFVPAANNARSVAIKMGYENEVGVQAPAGFFDPLGNLDMCFACR
jgi:hypothetical protein